MMFRLIGVVTSAILFGGLFYLLAFLLGNTNFLLETLNDQLLTILATLMGLNLVNCTFLITEISKFEVWLHEHEINNDYSSVRNEIKQNILFMISLFIAAIFVGVTTSIGNANGCLKAIMGSCIVAILLLAVFSFWQSVKALFDFDEFKKNIRKRK